MGKLSRTNGVGFVAKNSRRCTLPGLFCSGGHWFVFVGAIFGCGDFSGRHSSDAASNVDAVRDSGKPSRVPAFVRYGFWDCGSVQMCTVPAPGSGTGLVVLVTVTYRPPTVHAVSVTDDSVQLFQRASGPIPWAAGDGDSQTELWWGHRGAATSAISVNFSEKVSSMNVYVSEFSATAVDQAVAAVGKATDKGVISSGMRAIDHVPQLVVGHAEGRNTLLSPGAEFTQLLKESEGMQEAKVAEIPGVYQAPFMLDRSGHWIVLMATLR
jgi:hypothetical protein